MLSHVVWQHLDNCSSNIMIRWCCSVRIVVCSARIELIWSKYSLDNGFWLFALITAIDWDFEEIVTVFVGAAVVVVVVVVVDKVEFWYEQRKLAVLGP